MKLLTNLISFHDEFCLEKSIDIFADAGFDAGHANVCGQDVAGMIEELEGYISCTHIHDNNGVRDLHTLPFFGNINWESVMEALANINYCGNLSFEAGAFVYNVPLDLKSESAKYMAKTGKYLIERYEHYKAQ